MARAERNVLAKQRQHLSNSSLSIIFIYHCTICYEAYTSTEKKVLILRLHPKVFEEVTGQRWKKCLGDRFHCEIDHNLRHSLYCFSTHSRLRELSSRPRASFSHQPALLQQWVCLVFFPFFLCRAPRVRLLPRLLRPLPPVSSSSSASLSSWASFTCLPSSS